MDGAVMVNIQVAGRRQLTPNHWSAAQTYTISPIPNARQPKHGDSDL